MTQDADSQRPARVIQTADAIKRLCAPLCNLPLQTPSISTQVVTLPPPPSIRPKLVALGLDAHLVADFARKYDRACGDLYSAAQLSLQHACRDFAALPEHSALTPLSQLSSRIIAAYTTRYTRSLEALDQRAMETASKLAKARGLDKKVPKRKVRTCSTPFNHEFTPFLEKYFEYNAYPSVADHEAMAKKSMMEPRQIKIWFQNHRKRAKDEGLSFRRLSATDPAPLELCLRSMEEKMEPYLIPDGLRQEVDSEVSEPGSDDEEDDDDFDSAQPETVSTTNPLDPPAPRHAYPLQFKSRLIFASTILQDQDFSFPPPNWPRKAGTSPRRADITIDELITTFGSLHVHDARRVVSPSFQIPTTVTVPSAPLPALVRSTQPTDKSKCRLAPLATTSLNTIHPQFGSSARRRAFRTSSPYAYTYTQPISDAAASTSTSPSGRRRKVAGPPRRTPTKRSSRQQRGASSAESDTDTSTSTSAPSRTPSLEFDAFSRTPSLDFFSRSSSSSSSSYPYSSYSRSSSTSSSSSCSSAGPATPSSSPSILPLELDFGKQPQQDQQQQFGFARYADVAPGAVWG